ncbi:NAD(P)-dependent oxidoreductase [Psychrobacter sanguinis]|uniref:NAD-binding protein n=1 Tax=Psychrobacter sanguinis TaxID=861445 RepID=A0A844M3P9_9GAMM|nr:NAD(P)-dependent oxidoreductase [Psychrobacter sanguinis]MUG33444.1 NAD-binding protein [Psychrobacter sanguinis]
MKKIGFIGTGIMGLPMALNILNAGFPLQVWNRSKPKLELLEKHGANIAHSPQTLAKQVDILILMLSDGETCNDMLFGEYELINNLTSSSTVIVMSSIPVETAQCQSKKLYERGINYLDAPVSGGEKGAIAGNLAIMVGGEDAVYRSVSEVLETMGRPVHVGPSGTGQLAKLVNQLIVATTIAAVSEGLVLAKQGGANPEKILSALAGGFADSLILQQHGKRMINEDFKPGGFAKWQLKDTHTALNYAKSLSLNLPVLTLVDTLFEHMVQEGWGELDHSGLIKYINKINRL